MDNPKDVTCIEWFFGAGGNSLGLREAIKGLRLVAACEIEGPAIANILAKMEKGWLDSAPIWTDCRTFPTEPFKDRINLFVASYPCGPFSNNGRRKSKDDPRYLWPYVIEAVRGIRPQYCFFENVAGHLSLGLNTVISDLEEADYRVEAGLFSAREVGATQLRKRVFILAHANAYGREASALPILRKENRPYPLRRCEWPKAPDEGRWTWEPTRVLSSESRLGRNANGIRNRVHRLRMLGNSVVPIVATKAFITLYERMWE